MKKYISAIAALFAAAACAGELADAPDGVQIELADDGSYKIVSVGTGTWDFNDPDDILDARKDAECKAKAAIVKFFKEELATEESAQAASSKVKSVKSDGENESVSVSKASVKTTMSSIRSSASKLLTGVVVLADEKIPSEKTYRVMVGVSSTTMKAAEGVSKRMDNASGAAAPAPAVASSSGASAPASAGASSAAAGCPEGWTVCVGVGSGRKAAVQAALVEGISQVYGQLLENDERQSERIAKLKTNASFMGEEISASAKTSLKTTESQTLTKTAGFVREYRVVQVVPKDGADEATVYALIVNPRAGGTAALMVKTPTMKIQDRTKTYQIGPKKRMSGAEVAQAVRFALPEGLANANKFLVLDASSMATAVKNTKLTKAMVAGGAAGGQELMQAGQGLTPDYTLESEIDEILYSKKMGMDKATKKFGTVFKMSVKMKVSLVNARTGQKVKSTSVALALDNDEISGLLAEDEDADLLSAALAKLADPIAEWIGK